MEWCGDYRHALKKLSNETSNSWKCQHTTQSTYDLHISWMKVWETFLCRSTSNCTKIISIAFNNSYSSRACFNYCGPYTISNISHNICIRSCSFIQWYSAASSTLLLLLEILGGLINCRLNCWYYSYLIAQCCLIRAFIKDFITGIIGGLIADIIAEFNCWWYGIVSLLQNSR